MFIQSKKGLSIIVGYVLLVVFATIIGVLVYRWQATYVPQDEYAACPEGASLFVVNKSYNCDTNILKFAVKNNGQFAIGGYFIYLKDDPEKTIATVEISGNNTDVSSRLSIYNINGVKLGRDTPAPLLENSFEPGEVEIEEFDLSHLIDDNVYGIEIVPIRWQKEGNKDVLASCKEQKISEDLNGCSDEECVPDNDAACAGRECGTVMNNCYEYVTCGSGSCSEEEFCDSTGNCVTSVGCIPNTCEALGYECSTWDVGCGVVRICGDYEGGCPEGEECYLETGQCVEEGSGGGGEYIENCPTWCADQPSYSTGICRQNAQQCTSYCGGTLESGGEIYGDCTSPTASCCCCP